MGTDSKVSEQMVDEGQNDPVTSEQSTEKVEEEEKQASTAKNQISKEITDPFDEILKIHLEKLLGTRRGSEELPMNLFTVSCLMMLAAKETEIESFPYLPPPRYTHENLIEEMAEISIQPTDDIASGINFMIEKGYIEVADDGRFFAGKPTINIATLLDRAFPNMPGLNLVAYLGQMMDEATSGRKDTETAISQFDQMLEMQGVSIYKDTEDSAPRVKTFKHLRVGDDKPKAKSKKILSKKIKPSDIYSQLQTKTPSVSPAPLPDIQTNGFDKQEDDSIDDVVSDAAIAEDIRVEPIDEIEQKDTLDEKEPSSTDIDEIIEDDSGSVEPYGPDQTLSQTDIESTSEEFQPATTHPFVESESDHPISSEIPTEESTTIIDDEDIEKRITDFEQQLGMICPLCGTGGIKADETARGKVYYHCVNNTCNFISWGKPYHLTCPQCSNPFLIESTNSMGQAMLKCPRATCHHWQNFPWDEKEEMDEPQELSPSPEKKRKVRKVRRRRRVVRRKK